MAKPDSKVERKPQRRKTGDPVLLMQGVGKQLWKHEQATVLSSASVLKIRRHRKPERSEAPAAA